MSVYVPPGVLKSTLIRREKEKCPHTIWQVCSGIKPLEQHPQQTAQHLLHNSLGHITATKQCKAKLYSDNTKWQKQLNDIYFIHQKENTTNLHCNITTTAAATAAVASAARRKSRRRRSRRRRRQRRRRRGGEGGGGEEEEEEEEEEEKEEQQQHNNDNNNNTLRKNFFYNLLLENAHQICVWFKFAYLTLHNHRLVTYMLLPFFKATSDYIKVPV